MLVDPVVPTIQVHVTNPAGWLSAAAALVSSVSALVAIIFSRLSSRAALSVSRIDQNINPTPMECIYSQSFQIKNYGKEKVDILSMTLHRYDLKSSQLLMVYSSAGGFSYFQDAEHLHLNNHLKVSPPYPAVINFSAPLDPINLPVYQAMFPMFVGIITLEYKRRNKVFQEPVKEYHAFEIEPFSTQPINLEKYPALKKLLP
jgi:hypothetical protein